MSTLMNVLMVVVIFLGVIMSFAIFYYFRTKDSTPRYRQHESIYDHYDPSMHRGLAESERANSLARTNLLGQLIQEDTALYEAQYLPTEITLQHIERESRHEVILSRDRNEIAANDSASQLGLSRHVLEQILLLRNGGEHVRTELEITKKEQMDELEIKRIKAEKKIDFDYGVKYDVWEQKRLIQADDGEDVEGSDEDPYRR